MLTEMDSQFPGSPAERRVYRREPSTSMVLCRTPEQGVVESVRGTTLDISLGGACIVLPINVAVGQTIILEFLTIKYRPAFTTSAIVKWVSPGIGGQFRIGCEFSKPVELSKLLDLVR